MYKVQLENMLVQHVYPEFKSSLGYLRARVGKVVVYIFVVTRKKFCFSCPCFVFALLQADSYMPFPSVHPIKLLIRTSN